MTPNTVISISAYRKLGTLTPTVAKIITEFCTHCRLDNAAMMPSTMPVTMEKTKATPPSLAVIGSALAMMELTLIPLRVIDSPKSLCSTFLM